VQEKTELTGEPSQEHADSTSEEPYERVIHRVDHQQEIDATMKALAELPQRQCETIVLREMCDLSTAQIAHTLGIKEGTVRYHLSEGFRRLKGLLLPGAERSGTHEQ
jgi:RNA polymerase sigma factor (sigma-70 family)